MRKLPLFLMAIALTACGKSAEQKTADSLAAAQAAVPAIPPAPPAPTITDPQIAAVVLAANNVDIDAGKMAVAQGKAANVKAFARQMIQDHGALNKAVNDLIKRVNVTAEDNPTSLQLTDGGKAFRDAAKDKKGADFDKAYIDNEVAYHQAVLDAIDKTLIPGAQNPELKTLLTSARASVDSHLQMAKKTQGELPATP